MSSLSDKLKSLGLQIGAKGISPPSNSPPTDPLIDVLPGYWKPTPHGDTFIVENQYPLDYSLGSVSLQPSIYTPPLTKWLKNPALEHTPLDHFAFIDTETTGLSGGAGVYVFLIGVGRFIDDHFQISQFFLSDPAQETAQLSALEEYLAPAEVVVSYNGKSFDLPRLKTRYRAHRWPPPLQEISHIDLLHLARRLWKNRLSSCTLGDIEYNILNFERSEEDVPGWQVSDLFHEYIHTQNPKPLKQVFYHNEMDVLSMVGILNRISTLLNPGSACQTDHPEELSSVGKFYADLKEPKTAINLLEESLTRFDSVSDPYLESLKTLSFLYKKSENFEKAVSYWKEAAENEEYYAFLELAKYFEHRQKNFEEAIHWTLSAISIIDSTAGKAHQSQAHKSDLEHRLNRLKGKAS
ncbi:MAG: ribonuclease H-like domain-containing protein [Anaerolineales bacterium]|nr:ribonuclease H-like domain-containing protein [Anaerolineales bacterium]MBS3752852.1 ribonuclease H-like domain-containing protein [Anaerolineales bacterium]